MLTQRPPPPVPGLEASAPPAQPLALENAGTGQVDVVIGHVATPTELNQDLQQQIRELTQRVRALALENANIYKKLEEFEHC